MDVNGDLLCLMIFHTDQQVVPKPPTGIVEHRDQHFLGLLLIEHPRSRFTEDADSPVVSQVYFLGAI